MEHPTYCSLPFTSIAPKSWQNGRPHRVTPCCNMKTDTDDPMDVKPLIVQGASLEDIFNSEQFEKLRQDLLAGIKNPACSYCWRMEERSGTSPRLTAIDEIDQPVKTALVKLDTMVDESCNLRCRMCSPSVSNSLRQDYSRIVDLELPLPEYYNIKEKQSQADPLGTQTFFSPGSDYQQEIIKLANTGLQELKFTGGEPTTSGVFWNILGGIDNKESVKLHLTTNGTKFNQRFLDAASKFGSRHFTLSIDGTRSTYEYIRYPFSWRQLEKNIEKLCDTQDPATTEIHICSVLTIYNMINVRNLIDWIHQHNWFNEHKITWKCIPDPHPVDSCLDVKWASPELLDIAYKNIQAVLEESTEYTLPAVVKTLNYIGSCIRDIPDPEQTRIKRQQLKRDTLTLDIVRQQNFDEILYPQIAEFISNIRILD